MLQDVFHKPPLSIDPAFLTQAIPRSINLISHPQSFELLPFKNDRRGNHLSFGTTTTYSYYLILPEEAYLTFLWLLWSATLGGRGTNGSPISSIL